LQVPGPVFDPRCYDWAKPSTLGPVGTLVAARAGQAVRGRRRPATPAELAGRIVQGYRFTWYGRPLLCNFDAAPCRNSTTSPSSFSTYAFAAPVTARMVGATASGSSSIGTCATSGRTMKMAFGSASRTTPS
jgi:hypothetical protein